MLEKAIEIEGLLRIIRDGNPLPETYILLNIKAAELAEQAVCLEEEATAPKPEPQHADFVMAPPSSPVPTLPEVVFSVQKPDANKTSVLHTIDVLSDLGEDDPDLGNEDLGLIEEDDILLTFEEPAEFSLSPSQTEEVSPIPISTEQSATEGVEEDEAEDETVEDTHAISIPKEKEITPKEPELSVKEPKVREVKGNAAPAATVVKGDVKNTPQPKRQQKLKAAFSLNDRFLYSRELFEGNMKMFDSTLEFLEGIEDYSIIEDYFYSELEWDPENSYVAAFMEILRPHFREL